MTNAQIIFNESVNLMNAGVIGTTGRSFTAKNENGEDVTLYEPEPLHTYAKWKEYGYQVKRGEHAKATIYIWKAGKGKAKEEDEAADGETGDGVRMFMKKAFFFTFSQCEPIAATA